MHISRTDETVKKIQEELGVTEAINKVIFS